MLGREHQEVRAVDRIDARREDVDLAERDPRPFRPSDPVPLHRQHFFRPLVEPLGRLQQLVGIVGDAEEPLLELAHLDDRAAPPALAVDDLLVGEDGLAARAPVDLRALLVRQVALEHLQEQPLIPAVVLRLAGRELALPRVAHPHALELPLHVGDVGERPGLGVGGVLDRGVLGRKAEGVPAERMQHVEAAHPLHAGEHVADHVVAEVPHVRVPRRVREHLQTVELRPGVVLRHFEGTLAPPAFLPLPFDCLGFVIGHATRLYRLQGMFLAIGGPTTFVTPTGRWRQHHIAAW